MRKKNYWPRTRSKTTRPSPAKGEGQHGLTHEPVLFNEVMDGLAIKRDGIYIDATFGRGGHTEGILRQLSDTGRVFALDKDPLAVEAALLVGDTRLCVEQGSFASLFDWMTKLSLVGKVDGILLDLGVSSPQLDDPQRGFSFLREGPLDMRMDPASGIDAASWINSATKEEIAKVLKEYGEERFSKRIASAIVASRVLAPIKTTTELAEIVANANPKWEANKHPATRTFQAIRIYINDELNVLMQGLEQALEVLTIGGRLAVISFHSLEDRIVKQFIKKNSQPNDFPRDIPVRDDHFVARLKKIGRAIFATKEEIKNNSRARSAVLRIAEKLA